MGRRKIEETSQATSYHLRQAKTLGLYRKANRGAWYVPIWIEGKRTVRSTGTADVAEALARVPSLRAEVEEQAGELSRRAGLWDFQEATEAHYQEKKKAGRVPNTLKGYRTCSRHMIAFFGASFLLEDLTKDRIQEYISKARETRKPYTVQIEINYLGGLVNWTHGKGKCSKPAAEVLPDGVWGNYKPRKRFLSPEELGALLSVCPPDWQACVKGWTYLGAALNELFSIRVCDVDFRNGLVTINGTKTETRLRTIPIPHPIKPTLQRLTKGKKPSEVVFPRPKGERGGTSDIHIQDRFHRLREKAGVSHCTIHDLRRTCGSLLASQGVSLHIIGRILGHAPGSPVTAKTYAHLTDDALAKAMAKLPEPVSDNAAE